MQSKEADHLRDDLIGKYRKYVSHVTGRILSSMNLSSELFDELEAAGYLGLVEAAERFDPARIAEFKSWASIRIRGAIIDALRNTSNLSGRAYHYAKALQAANDLRERLHAEGDVAWQCPQVKSQKARLAAALDYAAKGAVAFRLSISDAEEEIEERNESSVTAESALERHQEILKLHKLVETLPENERIIIEEYYFRQKSFKQISDENQSMSKSWVSRLHARGLERLKNMWFEEDQA